MAVQVPLADTWSGLLAAGDYGLGGSITTKYKEADRDNNKLPAGLILRVQ